MDANLTEQTKQADELLTTARAQLHAGACAAAAETLTQAIELRPDAWLLYYYRGIAHATNKEREQAVHEYDLALSLLNRASETGNSEHDHIHKATVSARKAVALRSLRSDEAAGNAILAAFRLDARNADAHEAAAAFAYFPRKITDEIHKLAAGKERREEIAMPTIKEWDTRPLQPRPVRAPRRLDDVAEALLDAIEEGMRYD